VNDPRPEFGPICVVPVRVPDPVIEETPGCPDENTVGAAGTEDAIPLEIIFDICMATEV
jgi:hypothetical protein